VAVAYPLNPDLLDTGTPPIPAARAWLAAYDGRHGPAIDLSQGAPGCAPPASLLAAAAEAGRSPEAARYGAIQGETSLRTALAADIAETYGADVTPEDITITAGCNQAYVATVLALARAGDNVILPAPWYFNHQMTLRMLGIEARVLATPAERGFIPDAGDAASLIDERTRAVVLVTPNNPTGAVYPPETLAAFAQLARARGLPLIVDETYRDFMPDGIMRPHELLAEPGWRDSIIQLYSFSKSYAVPGWRLGAIIAGDAIQREIGKALDSLQICPARAGQIAIAPAVRDLKPWREAMRAEVNARAAAFSRAMRGLNGWSVEQIGAYFAYVSHPFDGVSAEEVGEMLARRWGVLALPGPYFGPGQERRLRFAFANADTGSITEAVSRLARIGP
jgi:aspartate/methionine/tyrosine aminotransferase